MTMKVRRKNGGLSPQEKREVLDAVPPGRSEIAPQLVKRYADPWTLVLFDETGKPCRALTFPTAALAEEALDLVFRERMKKEPRDDEQR